MESGLHKLIRIDQRIDGDFPGAFEGGTVGTDMEVDGIDCGHKLVYSTLVL